MQRPVRPAVGDSFTLVNFTHATNAVTSTFGGGQQQHVRRRRQPLRHPLQRRTGNDVVLHALPAATPSVLYVNETGRREPFPSRRGTATGAVGPTTAYSLRCFATVDDALAAYPSYAGPIVVNGDLRLAAWPAAGPSHAARSGSDQRPAERHVPEPDRDWAMRSPRVLRGRRATCSSNRAPRA